MPRPCTICDHPTRASLEAALTAGVSLRQVAGRYDVGLHALHRHQRSHTETPVETRTETASETGHTETHLVAPSPEPPPQPDRPSPTPRDLIRAKQRAFLRELAKTGNKKRSAEAVGIDPDLPHYWASRHPGFAEKMAEAQARGEQVLLAEYEQLMHGRILAGVKDNASALLTMFRVKRLDPRYRDGSGVTVNAQGPVAITLGLEATSGPQDVGVEAHARDVTPRRVKDLA